MTLLFLASHLSGGRRVEEYLEGVLPPKDESVNTQALPKSVDICLRDKNFCQEISVMVGYASLCQFGNQHQVSSMCRHLKLSNVCFSIISFVVRYRNDPGIVRTLKDPKLFVETMRAIMVLDGYHLIGFVKGLVAVGASLELDPEMFITPLLDWPTTFKAIDSSKVFSLPIFKEKPQNCVKR